MNWTIRQVSAISPEAKVYFDILAADPTFGITNNITKTTLRIISALPSSEIHVFQDETQTIVWWILLSHISTTALIRENLKYFRTFLKLHRDWYKYAWYLVVDESVRWKWYAGLMWEIKSNFYIYMANPKREEKVIREWWEVILDRNWNEIYKWESRYFKVSQSQT